VFCEHTSAEWTVDYDRLAAGGLRKQPAGGEDNRRLAVLEKVPNEPSIASVHPFATERLDKTEGLKLKGMLAYVKSVEPAFLVHLRQNYGGVIFQIQTLV
jgi:hypothetical protein